MVSKKHLTKRKNYLGGGSIFIIIAALYDAIILLKIQSRNVSEHYSLVFQDVGCNSSCYGGNQSWRYDVIVAAAAAQMKMKFQSSNEAPSVSSLTPEAARENIVDDCLHANNKVANVTTNICRECSKCRVNISTVYQMRQI
jgi:hypothetical protein